MNRRLIVGTVGVALVAGFAASATAKVPTAPGGNTLQCFSGTTDGPDFGGTCTLPTSGAKGLAILDVNSTNVNGDYAGAYVSTTTLSGVAVGSISQLSYNYTATKAPLTAGDLSMNVPIDYLTDTGEPIDPNDPSQGNIMTPGPDGATDAYVFADAAYCPGVLGVVDVKNDPTCSVWFAGTQYSNWADFVAHAPTGAIVTSGGFPFVIAERTPTENVFSVTVSNVKIGKGGSLPGKKQH